MMTAGRIKNHLANNIENPKNTLLIVGFCSPGTLGWRLREGESEVRIFGEEKQVRCDIRILDSFSAHGDQGEMIDFLGDQNRHKLKKIFLVHGEISRQEKFKEALLDDKFQSIEIPHLGQSYNLEI